jgi:predicted phage terminase large subunit-like protein
MSTAALLRRVERLAQSTAVTARSKDPGAELAYEDLGAFATEMLNVIPVEHHWLLIAELEAIERCENNRLMVLMPPGSAKSSYASVAFPPWYLGRNPSKAIITGSYGQRLSMRFGRKCRNIVARPRYGEIFGTGLAADSSAKDEWETSAGGEFTATSVDGAVTGRRGDVILVDDPVKGRAEADNENARETAWTWWISDLRPRLKPGGAIVLVMTHWHEDDIAGRILPADYDGQSGTIRARDGEVWRVISIRAEAEADDPLGRPVGAFLWPEWFRAEDLAREKIIQGPRNWAALYQQRPSPEEGDFFKKEWLRWYDRPPARETMRIYGASDYAVTADDGDFTVHGIAGVDPNDDIYLLDWWRKQTASDEWVEAFCDLVLTWKPLQWAEETGQIEKGVGPFLNKRQLERSAYCYRDGFRSGADKPTRAQSIRGRMAMGKVYLPRNAPWANDLVSELLRFPAGKNDDQVDVMGLFGRMLDRMVKGSKPPEETDIWRQPTWNDLVVAHDKNRQSAGRPRRI